MDAQHWLDEFRAELARRKLPPFYVERLVSELSDHVTDFLEDRMSTDAQNLHGVFHRLGAPSQVAATAASEFRKQRFSRRHPVLTFVVMPVATLFGLWIGSLALLGVCAHFIQPRVDPGDRFSEWLVAAFPIVAAGIVLAPIAVSAFWFCRIAGRSAIHWKWPLAACLLLAIVGGAAFFDMKLPGSDGVLHGTKFFDPHTGDPAKGNLMFGFGLNTFPRPWQMLQFSIPLAICGWAIYRQLGIRQLGGPPRPMTPA